MYLNLSNSSFYIIYLRWHKRASEIFYLPRAHAITTSCARNSYHLRTRYLLRAHVQAIGQHMGYRARDSYCVRTWYLLRSNTIPTMSEVATACTRDTYYVCTRYVLRAHAIATYYVRTCKLLRAHVIAIACARSS
jgi:hypothetical protein